MGLPGKSLETHRLVSRTQNWNLYLKWKFLDQFQWNWLVARATDLSQDFGQDMEEAEISSQAAKVGVETPQTRPHQDLVFICSRVLAFVDPFLLFTIFIISLSNS